MEVNFIKIQSPGYGVKNYPDKLDCSWTIKHPKGESLTLFFEDFVTEALFDFVKVRSAVFISYNYIFNYSF